MNYNKANCLNVIKITSLKVEICIFFLFFDNLYITKTYCKLHFSSQLEIKIKS